MNKRGLGGGLLGQGRGSNVASMLEALAVTPGGGGEQLREVPLRAIARSPYQPRTAMDPARLAELAVSMAGPAGVLQPVLLRPLPGGRYELLAGERRLEAAKLAKLRSIPARVREVDDLE
ncbi:MAG: ParB N-terminal domain-containing protein, partial [Gemmatimonadales bacterium]|nr:ParB N-terminal domain-containing protein [Gemmatimonadales bacterium]